MAKGKHMYAVSTLISKIIFHDKITQLYA